MSDLANHGEDQALDALTDQPYIKLHTGAPGEDGTSNAATETTRQQVTMGAASSGTRTSTTDLEWADVAATETITHVSAWDASTSGNCEWIAALDESKALTAGDTLQIATGDLTFSLD